MAYDDVIRIDALESLFKSSAKQKAQVELLTLNACETSEGDGRAPLSLSGVVLRARVRSAIGILWLINDVVPNTLMTVFSCYLKESNIGKSEALRVQKTLLEKPGMNHPY